MSTGFIWVAAILILGGVIATVGDRIGTKVGKARLSLFKLRPRKTATLVTILTGTVISASSLGILLAADNRLRAGLFEIGRIQEQLEDKRKELTNTRKQLDATNQQKIQVEKELAKALSEQKAQQVEAQKQQAAAQKRLAAAINQSLRSVLINQIRTQSQLNRTRSQLSQVTSQFQQAQARLNTVSQQAKKLRQEIQQSQSELQKLVAQRNELKARITQRDREIVNLDEEIQQRGEARRHAARGGVAEDDEEGQPRLLHHARGDHGARHLHERDRALLHPRAAGGGEHHQRAVLQHGQARGRHQRLAHARAHGTAEEGEFEGGAHGAVASDGAVRDHHRVLLAGARLRVLQPVGVAAPVAEAERVGGEVDWNLEISHVSKLTEEKKGPALLFENIKDYKNTRSTKLFTASLSTYSRLALMLDCAKNTHPRDLITRYIERTAQQMPPMPVTFRFLKPVSVRFWLRYSALE